MKRWHFILSLAILGTFNIVNLPVKAETVCKVTDPTGTPLNVRDRPNGRIINQLKNGKEVSIIKIAYASNGRPWAKVGGYHNGQYRIWGWIFREYISCYDR